MNQITIVPVTAFIDWNSQIHAAHPPKDDTITDVTKKTLAYVGRTLGSVLHEFATTFRFDVTLRVYHGWHKGFEVTPRRKALIQTIAGADFLALSEKPNVAIRQEVQFGDNLISASSSRIHLRLNCHLPNTLRNSLIKQGEEEEKMVDTAIASDVVDLAHRERERWLVVVGEDDDLIPPILTAEGLRESKDGRVFVIRNRAATPFLKISDISFKP